MFKNSFNKIFKDTKVFKWKSTITVFWRISTLILIVPIMLSNIFIIGYFISSSNNQIKAYHTETLYSKEKTVDAALVDMISKSYALANREIVRKFITISDYDSISNYQKSQISMAINSEIMQVVGGNKYVSSIYVYNSDSDYVIGKLFSADRWISELKQYSSSKKLSAVMVNEFIKSIKVYPDKRIEIEWKHQDTIAEYLEILNGGE